MILFSRIVEALVLPPGNALVVLLLALALLAMGRRRLAAALVALAALGLYALSTAPVAEALLRPLERRHPLAAAQPDACDVIVVLGRGARWLDSAPWPEELLTAGGLRRTLVALRLWRAKPRPVLLLGGRPLPDDPPLESYHRVALLNDLGIPPEHLVRLDDAGTTHAEALTVARAAREVGWRRPCLVTSAWHLPRAVAVFQHAGLSVEPIPCDHAAQDGPARLRDLLPSSTALRGSTLALREYLGIVYYRVRYGVRLAPGG